MQTQSLLDIKIQSSPEQFANLLKDGGDVFWWERGNFWIVTSHKYAKLILTSNDYTCDRSSFFISRMPNIDLSLITDFFAVVSKMMVMSDPPQHNARRRICYDGFSNQTLDAIEPLIIRLIEKQINQCIDKGYVELVEDFAKHIPCTILADFFHIPEEDRGQFYEWANNMTQFFGGASHYRNEDGIQVNNSASNIYCYFNRLLEKRRKRPENDFLTILLKNQKAFQLTNDEIISQAIMMLVAGQVTTTDQLCNNIYTLMSSPNVLQELKTRQMDLNLVIAELNRLDPAVTFIFRIAKQDIFIGKQAIKAGDVVFISTHAVNRDPRVFANPNQFLLSRNNHSHLSYGFGPHYCIGAKLAQLEMVHSFGQLLRRLPNLQLIPNDLPKRKHHSLSFSGFERLSLKFDYMHF